MIIKSTRVYIDETLRPAALELQNGRIAAILPYDGTPADADYAARMILPGFLDLHCHGAYGFDANSADPEGLKQWAKKIVAEGVTAFLPTTLTAPHGTLCAALHNIAAVQASLQPGKDGAEIAGIHLEGPFLNPAYAGAQPKDAIAPASPAVLQEYVDASRQLIRIVTLAPELDPGHALLRFCLRHGIAASIGHSAADAAECARAIADGAQSVTHTFNAQTPLAHREIGVAGTSLRRHDLYGEIICDMHHVHPDAVHIFFHCKDKDHAIMVSDALSCKGFPAGTRFLFGGQNAEIAPDGTARLTDTGGKTLAGSTMKMNEGLRNLITRAEVPFVNAVNACTINPARLLSLDDRIGSIRAGLDADLAVLDDGFGVEDVYCKGRRQDL